MNSRRHEIDIQLNQLLDALLLGGVFGFCYWLRASKIFILDSLWEIPPFSQFYWMLAVLMPFGPFLLEMQGFYHSPLEKTLARSVQQIVRAGAWLALFFAGAAFLFRLTIPSRSVLVLFGIFAFLALLAKDRLRSWASYRRLLRGGYREDILLVGEADCMREIEESLTRTQRLEIRIVQRVDLSSCPVEDLTRALHRHSVGRVILAIRQLPMNRVQEAVEACETEGVEAWLSARFIHTSVARPSYETFGRNPMLVFRATPEMSWGGMFKNAMDRVGAAVLLVVFSPLLLAATLAVRLSSPGPVIFRQQRAGLHGKPFVMLKFRTMFAGAELQREGLDDQNQMRGPVFKIENDPRITPVGRILRRTSIDELPQLWNVLQGNMSLVGPRPLPIYEVEKFERTGHRRRLSMKPGLTCLWQIRGRNQVMDFEDWVKMDLEYIDNWSIWLDLTILLRTIPAVLLGVGAK